MTSQLEEIHVITITTPGETFTAPEDGTYEVNTIKMQMKAGESVTPIKSIVEWPVGQSFFLKTQVFKAVEIGDKAVFLKREGQKDLTVDGVVPTKFFIGEHVAFSGNTWVMTHYFEPQDVYAFMPKDLWRATKEKVKLGILG
jgi:hypothetical protein